MLNKWFVLFIVFASVVTLAMIPTREHSDAFHSIEEWDRFVEHRMMNAPPDDDHIFPSASRCVGCHGHDEQMNAMIDWMGNDVNFYDDWSTSMMANSAIDPFWRAKVSHETLANPQHKMDLETKCTSCHAPQGHFTAILRGAEHYSMNEMKGDTIALDGVGCSACHAKSEIDLDKLFSGEANYDTTRVLYGPHIMPFAAPMNDFVGFKPVYSEHINDAGICASCHTLLTKSVDLEGNPTGREFVEQATYHEWINSDFDDEGATPQTCQSCHMPRLEESIVISSNYLFLEPRSPYALHDLIGANTTMIKLLKNNKKQLGIEAADEHFDETIAKTLEMLQKHSLDLEILDAGSDKDSLYIDLKLINKAGHKFPSGYPSRRVFVELKVTKEDGSSLFHSGAQDENHEVLSVDELIEPHHDVITSEDQVQIYEFIIGDVDGEITTLLERADVSIKDNRLPPRGFTTGHEVYDTTKIYGQALTDSDFNINDDGEEGSGADLLSYHIPVDGYEGTVKIEVNVYYQAIAPRWVKPMFEEIAPDIQIFKTMYENADLTPELVVRDSLLDVYVGSTAVGDFEDDAILVYPNPSNGFLTISLAEEFDELQLVDALGRVVLVYNQSNPKSTVDLSHLSTGLYIVTLSKGGKSYNRSIVIQK